MSVPSLLHRILQHDRDKQILILKGAIEGIQSALAYEIKTNKQNVERIEELEQSKV